MESSLGWLVVHEDDYTAYEDLFESIEGGHYNRMRESLIGTLAPGSTVPE